MKKGVIFGTMAGVMLLVLTGCDGGQTLTCTQNQEQDGRSMEAQMEIRFTNDRASSLSLQTQVSVTDEEDEVYLDSFIESMDELYEYESDGVKIDVDSSSKTATVVVTFDFGKMSDDEIDDAGFDSDDLSYETMKEEMEDTGFTCR